MSQRKQRLESTLIGFTVPDVRADACKHMMWHNAKVAAAMAGRIAQLQRAAEDGQWGSRY